MHLITIKGRGPIAVYTTLPRSSTSDAPGTAELRMSTDAWLFMIMTAHLHSPSETDDRIR